MSLATARSIAFPVTIGLASRAFSVALLLAMSRFAVNLPRLTSETAAPLAWDGQWYLQIATSGYRPDPQMVGPLRGRHDFAFLPGWPLTIDVLGLGQLPLGVVAVVASNVIFVAALVAIHRVLADRLGPDAASRGVALLAFNPAAYVFSMAYSESLFLLLVGLYFHAHWTKARPLLAAAAVLTKITGVAILVSAVIVAARTRQRWAIGVCAAGVLAIAGWWAYVWWLTGSPTAVLDARVWTTVAGPGAIWRVVVRPDLASLARLGLVAVVGVASIALVRRDQELAAYAITAVALALFGGSVASMPRYMLAAFPAFGIFGSVLGRRGTPVVVIASALGQAAFVWLAFAAREPASP